MVSRDEIKEGLVHGSGTGRPPWGASIAPKAYELFFETLSVLLTGGSSVVAEAAFISHLAQEELRPFVDVADCRIIECSTSPEVATERFRRRMNDPVRRAAHPDEEVLDSMRKQTFRWLDYQFPTDGVPLLRVDTTDGYDPVLEAILDFARDG
jgi:predicted kinase